MAKVKTASAKTPAKTNTVTIKDLCAEYGIEGHDLRALLRANGFKAPEVAREAGTFGPKARYEWPADSKEVTKIRGLIEAMMEEKPAPKTAAKAPAAAAGKKADKKTDKKAKEAPAPAPTDSDDDDGEEVDYREMTLEDLKAECVERGLPVSKKATVESLAVLLEADDEEDDEE